MPTAPRKPQDRQQKVQRPVRTVDLDLDALDIDDTEDRKPFSVRVNGQEVDFYGLEDVDPRVVMTLDQIDPANRLEALRAAVELLSAAIVDPTKVDVIMGLGMRKISVILQQYMEHSGAPDLGEGSASSI